LPSGVCRFIGQFFEGEFLPDNFCRFIGQNFENGKRWILFCPIKATRFGKNFA
jgi:hypothetical protein